MKKLLLYVIFFYVNMYCSAQQYNNWYFGLTAGISFNAAANAATPRATNDNAMISDEGNATISDSLGNLLFYTNGVSVYNKEHEIMLNGDQLNGNLSSFQSSIIVPHPGNKKLYYLFTSDAVDNNFANGYQYNIIDITKDAGKGEVISKNNLLIASGTERLTAVQHSNGIDVWVITNDNYSNIFRSWLITCNGLQTNEIISTSGEVLINLPEKNVGSLKVSPNGKILCQTHFSIFEFFANDHFFQLFDFDNTTGRISNPKKIAFPNRQPHSSEFSPNSRLLYLTDPIHNNLLQIDVTLPTVSSIMNSLDTIPCQYGFYGIQMGPNEKIYMCKYGKYLSAINNPNAKGILANFQDSALPLNAFAKLNLPNAINNAHVDPYNNFTYTIMDTCAGKVQFTAYSNLFGTVNYHWDFGDGITSNLQNPIHNFNPFNRQYTVRLVITAPNCGNRSIYKSQLVTPQGILAQPDFDFELDCDSAFVKFENKSNTHSTQNNYLWDFGDGNSSTITNPTHRYLATGVYPVTLVIPNTNPCLSNTITKNISYENVFATIIDSIEINEGESLLLNAQSNGTTFLWSPTISISDTSILRPIVNPIDDIRYTITAKNNAGCFGQDTIYVKVNPLKQFYIPSIFTPNNDNVNDLLIPAFSKTLKNISFKIHNRWGQLVFTGTSVNNYTWNGRYKNTPAANGIYVWQISGVKKKGGQERLSGTVMLMR
jgi:gliding motility-associated-like protein